MIDITIAQKGGEIYQAVAAFAVTVYRQQLNATIDAKPEYFSVATKDSEIIGCFGLYHAYQHNRLQIEQYVPDVFTRLTGQPEVDRNLCAELGTRAVIKQEGISSWYVSLALVAALLIEAKNEGIEYVAFTSNKRVRLITDKLGFPLSELGQPCLDHMDDEFRQNWATFFAVQQYCYGFHIHNLEGCHKALAELDKTNAARQPCGICA